MQDSTATPPAPRCDIFCRVVDNYGDAGVCWRLARQLAQRQGWRVRLWIDDLAPLARLQPAVDAGKLRQEVDGVTIARWNEAACDPAEVVIEAFACALPAGYVQAMAARPSLPRAGADALAFGSLTPGPSPGGRGECVWINLEYLSAEDWVAGCHLKSSPHPTLPLTKYFFFPGFDRNSGGLIGDFCSSLEPSSASEYAGEKAADRFSPLSPCGREAGREGGLFHRSSDEPPPPLPNPSPARGEGLCQCQASESALHQESGKPATPAVLPFLIPDSCPLIPEPLSPETLTLSLFCYHVPPSILDAWAGAEQPIHCLVADGLPNRAVAGWLGEDFPAGARVQRGALTLTALPFLPQPDYDALLSACALNFVRGEDSFVRAQWARRPLVWQIYPQDGGAHRIKLDAFLRRYGEGLDAVAAQALRAFWHAWNAPQDAAEMAAAWRGFRAQWPALAAHAAPWAQRLEAAGDLVENLAEFVRARL